MALIGNMPGTGSPSGTRGLKPKFVRTDPQVKSFTFRYQNLSPTNSTQKEGGWGESFVTLFVNPEEFTMTEPYRITVTPTKGGAFVDNFGQGIKTITIKGVTGYKERDIGGTKISGQKHFLYLRGLFRAWANRVEVEGSWYHRLYFYNWQDEDQYEVVINNFTLLRSTGRPLLYQYNIQLTCIKEISARASYREYTVTDETRMDELLADSKKRPPLILNKINSGLFTLDSLINGLVDMSGFSTGTQAWSKWIAKGKEFYNTVNRTYETIESLITSTHDLANDIGMYVEGASSFIKTPFELIQDAALAMGDVIDEMCSVTDIPHELVRTFRDMECAIKALTPVAFEGFTNPSLFEGASNCGTTLGISESAVSIYSNSFTATAKTPADRAVTQYFSNPQAILVLKEEPISVSGVFISTDTSRTGLNYLKSYSGMEVTLTSVPTVPVEIDYKVPQGTTTERLTLQAAQSVIVNSDDTLSKIAWKVYGDPTEWKIIALFNNIEYPYIVNYDFVTEVKATGTVRFYRDTSIAGAITIPKGTPLWVPAFQGTLEIDFVTSQDKVLNLAEAYVDVPVEALQYGEIGNVAPRLITGVGYTFTVTSANATVGATYTNNGKTFTVLTTIAAETTLYASGTGSPAASGVLTKASGTGDATIAFSACDFTGVSKILNITATRNGKIYKVAKPGDVLQIPKTEKTVRSVVTPSEPTFEQLFGVDIAINSSGEWNNIANILLSDVRLSYGTDNLVQALKHRIATRAGFYLHHITYGTSLPYYVGKKNVPYWQELAKSDMTQACLLDPRVNRLEDVSMTVDGDKVEIEMKAITTNETNSVSVQVVV